MEHTALQARPPASISHIEDACRAAGIPPTIVDVISGIASRYASSGQNQPSRFPDGPQPPASTPAPGLPQIASIMHKHTLRRTDLIGPYFHDPVWNMLLALFADREERGSVSTSSLCYASGVPSTTALRHLKAMHAAGMIDRFEDEKDGRLSLVELQPHMHALLEKVLTEFLNDKVIRSHCAQRLS